MVYQYYTLKDPNCNLLKLKTLGNDSKVLKTAFDKVL